MKMTCKNVDINEAIEHIRKMQAESIECREFWDAEALAVCINALSNKADVDLPKPKTTLPGRGNPLPKFTQVSGMHSLLVKLPSGEQSMLRTGAGTSEKLLRKVTLLTPLFEDGRMGTCLV